MARAVSIWIVIPKSYYVPVDPVAAFTVKHEMISWWVRQPDALNRFKVLRYKDNPALDEAQPVQVDMEYGGVM